MHNKAHPEGSIAEAYIADECLTLCSRYLNRVEARFNRTERNEEGVERQKHVLYVFMTMGKPLGKGNIKLLSHDE